MSGYEQEFHHNERQRRLWAVETVRTTVGTWCGDTGLIDCASLLRTNGQPVPTVPTMRSDDPSRASSPHLVGLGYDEQDPIRALDKALEQTVGFSRVKRGDSVYLRVNSNSGDPYPYSTSPRLIKAVGQRLRDLGVSDIRIGDRSFWGDPNTARNLDDNGIAEAARALGVKATVFDSSVKWVLLPSESVPSWTGKVRIPQAVATATHIINLACVKTHFIAHITMNLKLVLGLVHASDRRRPGNLDRHVQDRLWPQIAEINKNLTPTLNILDGFEAVVSGGPTIDDRPPRANGDWKPQTAAPHVIVISTDRIAADVVGAAILQMFSPSYEEVQRHAPFSLPQIRTAIDAGGLGIDGPNALDMAGPSVPELRRYREKAIAAN